jgi:hypothetical protein
MIFLLTRPSAVSPLSIYFKNKDKFLFLFIKIYLNLFIYSEINK